MSILLVGATSRLGQHFVEAARELNIPLVVSLRPESAQNPAKLELVKGFPIREASLKDYPSLVKACEGIEAVICITSGDNFASQIDLINAAKEAGVKRFIPSEYSCDLIHADSPAIYGYQDKTKVREYLQASGLEWTSIQSNAFMSWFGPACFNMLGKPYPKSVEIYDGGDTPVTLTNQIDIGKVTLRAALDPRAANKHVVIAFPGNTMTQNELVSLWEEISKTSVERVQLSKEDIEKRKVDAYAAGQYLVGVTMHVVQGYVVAKLSTGQVHDGQLLAHELFPELTYTTIRAYYEDLAVKHAPQL